jgi:hypothetical protein
MNHHDLWMIGGGAVLALVLTSAAKWIFALFDAIVPVSKAPDKLRTVFSVKANRSLFWTSLLLLYEISAIVFFAFDKSPLTRLSILYGALLVVCSTFIFGVFMWEVLAVLSERRRAKAAESATSSR